jgi:release factor glutamine methyltransferase
MKCVQWLQNNTGLLKSSGIDTARLDTLVLLEDCIGKNRAHLLAYPELELTGEQITILDEQIKRRMSHEPLAYIRGRSEFYGRIFAVDKNVLVPRPESEMMIDVLLRLSMPESISIIDVGTGSGALSITAKLQLPQADVYATDIDRGCITLASQNAQTLQSDVTFIQGNLIEPAMHILTDVSVLLCNLPYVPDEYHINTAATHEPSLAIFGGSDGLEIYRRLFNQINTLGRKPQFILTESLPFQHDALLDIATAHRYSLKTTEDFIQVFELTPAR